MQNKVLQVSDILSQDRLATQIANTYLTWENSRQVAKQTWDEIRRYKYATDTSMTTNSQNPWKNKTTIPKLCQIADNLYANYTATLFPQRKSVLWEANEKDSNSVSKREAITNYMSWVMQQPSFKTEIYKVILDYIDFGNCFVTVEWADERVELDDKVQAGYVGPSVRRISPLDIVMNPTGATFVHTPKIIRSMLNLGEVKDMLEKMSNDQNRQDYEELWHYMKDLRGKATTYEGDWSANDSLYAIDGFDSYRSYLCSGYAEILTFYGDIYDEDNDDFLKNQVITVVDRHRLVSKKPNPSYFGYPPIFHSPWRKKQDNLWGMGPLDNLVGMQYRLDHVENMKADIYDLTTYPVQMITGFVEDYVWQPAEKIFVGEEGKVELITPDVNALQANFELDALERRMEEMAGAPREALGIRSPGEKTKFEVQQLQNASSRLYQNKIKQFEEEILEPLLNAMLELAKRNMTSTTTISVFDNEMKQASFQTLTVEDITGAGRIKPVAARHFAEQAQLAQELQTLSSSNIWPMIQPHFSGVKMAEIYEKMLNLEDYGVYTPFIAITEQADAQKIAQASEEQVAQQTMTATGMGDDFDIDQLPAQGPQVPQGF